MDDLLEDHFYADVNAGGRSFRYSDRSFIKLLLFKVDCSIVYAVDLIVSLSLPFT